MTEPIRILRIISRMNVGGPAWQTSVLTESLEGKEFSTKLLCGDVGSDEGDYLKLYEPKIQFTKINSLGRSVSFIGDLKAFIKIRREITSYRPHIVHTHTAKAGVLGRLAAYSARVPIIVHTFHGHLLQGYFSKTTTSIIRKFELWLARSSTALIAVGSKVRNDLISAGIGRDEQFSVVPPGVNFFPKTDRETARAKLGLSQDVPVVTFVGRLTKIKRPDRLIQVMKLVKQAMPEVVLLIVGEGDLLSSIEKDTKEFGDSVRVLGWRDDLENIYAAADLSLLTSDNEGMPVSLIESAAAGLPCVATDVGSVCEVVINNETGLVVESSATALTAAIVKLLSDEPLRRRMGQAALKHAEKNFTVERLIEDHISLYKKLVVSTLQSDNE